MVTTGKPDPEGLGLLNVALAEGLISPVAWADILSTRAAELKSGDRPRDMKVILVDDGYLTIEQLTIVERKRAQPETFPDHARPDPDPSDPGPTAPPGVIAPQNFGKFRLLKQLFRRHRTAVYEAFDTRNSMTVLLKILEPGKNEYDSTNQTQKFLKDAKFASTLAGNDTVARVYEVGAVGNRRFIASELVKGLPLSKWMRQSVPLRRQVMLLRDLASGIFEMHLQGIVHRDVSPDKILVDDQERPHLSEFGLARALKDLFATENSEAVSSRDVVYRAPEVLNGSDKADPRMDIYSLGAILYEMLTGRIPFRGKTAVETAMNVTRGDLVRPSLAATKSMREAIDPVLEAVCLRALERDPDRRHETMGEMADELSGWLEGRPPKRLPLSRNHRRLLVISTVLLALILLGLIFILSGTP